MDPDTATFEPELIRVAIVEDDKHTRDGLGILLNASPGYCCVGAYRSMEEALRGIADVAPQVLLLDIGLPGMTGSDGVRIVRDRYPCVQILMLTVYAGQDHVFQSICNGACGYLLKKTPPVKLLEGIREVHEGGAPMSPEIARKVITLFRKTPPPDPLERQLTPHEIRLLQFLSQGYSYKAVGDRLGISINTVRNHIRSIYDKLHVHSKSEAVTRALRSRLI